MSLTSHIGSLLYSPSDLSRWIGWKICAKSCTSTARLDGKTVIITGGNAGIGKESAIDLARRGAKVVICCRDEERGANALKEIKEKSNSNNIELCQLDLASFKSVRQAAKHLLKTQPQIHILINNAGIMACPRSVTEDGHELQFQTNHLGHFLLTLLLLDRIKKSAPARIVNISSSLHIFGTIKFDDINSESTYSRLGAYGQSKLANILFTRELSQKLNGSKVSVYAVHPGFVATGLGRFVGSFKSIVFKLSELLFAKDVVLGAQTTIYCAVDQKAGEETGLFYADCSPLIPTPEALDESTAKRLWDLSIKACELDVDPTF